LRTVCIFNKSDQQEEFYIFTAIYFIIFGFTNIYQTNNFEFKNKLKIQNIDIQLLNYKFLLICLQKVKTGHKTQKIPPFQTGISILDLAYFCIALNELLRFKV